MSSSPMLESWLDDLVAETFLFALHNHPHPSPPTALDTALDKITTAVARLYRAGPVFKRKSEAFWIFVAGCWSGEKFDAEVREARGLLPKVITVEEDVWEARRGVMEAVEMLRKEESTVGDARDLEECLERFEGGGERG